MLLTHNSTSAAQDAVGADLQQMAIMAGLILGAKFLVIIMRD